MASSEEKQVMIVGVDRNGHSFYALQWTLDRFFSPYASNPPFKLIVVHVKPTPAFDESFLGTGAEKFMLQLDENSEKMAARIAEVAKDICLQKSVNDVVIEVVEGDAGKALCEVVKKRNAFLLVVGSHDGFTGDLRIGSVSDWCVHHAHCSVMVVKKTDSSS